MAIDNIRQSTGAGGLDAYGKTGSEKDSGKTLEMLMTKKENISSEINKLEELLSESKAKNQTNKFEIIKNYINLLNLKKQQVEKQITQIQADPSAIAEQSSTSSGTAPTPGGESTIRLTDEGKKVAAADKKAAEDAMTDANNKIAESAKTEAANNIAEAAKTDANNKAKETQSVKSLINEINTKPITAETAKNYFEAAAGKDAKWLKDNIWSKTNMGELETLSEKLSTMEGSSSDTINSPSGPIPNPLNNKEIRLQTLELKNYISETKENTDMPEAVQKYDADKSGKITEDEVKNINEFQKDLSGLSKDEQKHILKQHLSDKLKTDLLEKLFIKKR